MSDETSADDAVDPTRCPLCGAGNSCAMASEADESSGAEPCWCVGESFSAELLDGVPAAAAGRACICRACLEAAQAKPSG